MRQLFHSVPPERHGILVNTFVPMARPVPGLVDLLASAGKKCGSFFSWEPLRDISRPGSLEVSAFLGYRGILEESDGQVARTALPHILSGDLDFIFLYFHTIDEAGHDFGWMSERYLRQVGIVDGLVGTVMEAVSADATVIIHSDHGGHGRNHGSDCPEDVTVPWIAAGPGIRCDHPIAAQVEVLDTAPTVARIWGSSQARIGRVGSSRKYSMRMLDGGTPVAGVATRRNGQIRTGPGSCLNSFRISSSIRPASCAASTIPGAPSTYSMLASPWKPSCSRVSNS